MQIINQSKSKKKILMLSDHAMSTSGVGCQSRFLIQGLVDKGCWTVRQFGAAVKHPNYDIVTVNPDFIIKPIDGFGNRDVLLQAIASEQPDILFLFTDPRFFIYVWEMHEEINKICPIAYWHVWDNRPAPVFNKVLYEATDLINCHSHLTYEMVSEIVPGKANFVPHALPDELFFPIPEAEVKQHRINVLGPERQDHFVVFWVNRNARRKRPADVIEAWSKFMKMLEAEGKSDATLVMHTDPTDKEGPNLLVNTEAMGVVQSVVFSNQRIEFEKMNVLHNISDCCINIAYAEGFGLATLEAMKVGKPVIAIKTGGLTRQVVDHRDGSENGIALDVEMQTLVGSQLVPYIYEDYVSTDTVAKALYDMYKMGAEKRKALGQKARDYVQSEFAMQTTIDKWHETLWDLSENYQKDGKYCLEEIA
jgi:glycosyltransferase involved in cell wall biosynthesis